MVLHFVDGLQHSNQLGAQNVTQHNVTDMKKEQKQRRLQDISQN